MTSDEEVTKLGLQFVSDPQLSVTWFRVNDPERSI